MSVQKQAQSELKNVFRKCTWGQPSQQSSEPTDRDSVWL